MPVGENWKQEKLGQIFAHAVIVTETKLGLHKDVDATQTAERGGELVNVYCEDTGHAFDLEEDIQAKVDKINRQVEGIAQKWTQFQRALKLTGISQEEGKAVRDKGSLILKQEFFSQNGLLLPKRELELRKLFPQQSLLGKRWSNSTQRSVRKDLVGLALSAQVNVLSEMKALQRERFLVPDPKTIQFLDKTLEAVTQGRIKPRNWLKERIEKGTAWTRGKFGLKRK